VRRKGRSGDQRKKRSVNRDDEREERFESAQNALYILDTYPSVRKKKRKRVSQTGHDGS